jgi:hypothetical protein
MNKIISIGAAFLLGVGAGWIVQGRHWDAFLTSYIPALATLLAAFYGAKYAFQFQKDKELDDIKKQNIANANAAIFDLMRMANTLFVYQRDLIQPIKTSPFYFVELMPSPQFEKLVKLNIQGLYFILETDYRNLIGAIIVEEERYRSVIDSINMRSKLHLEEFQPALERTVLPDAHSLESIRNVVGDRIYVSLKSSTDQVIDQVESYIASLEEVGNKLTQCMKQIYPDDVIISFILPRN